VGFDVLYRLESTFEKGRYRRFFSHSSHPSIAISASGGENRFMITGELKSKVDRIWDTMWSGGISNPLSVIEQLTYLLFIKRLDELHTLRERKAARTGKPIEEPIFEAGQNHLRWSRFKKTAPEQMFVTVKDEVFPFIKTLGNNGGAEEEGDSTYSHHMKDAIFMMPTPRVLTNVVDQLDSINMADTDTKGDLYEYMLGKIASAGQNGQFLTPRHIIRLMVDMTAPVPKDVICDPACGTAGFLIAASEYLRRHHGDAIYKTEESRRKFNLCPQPGRHGPIGGPGGLLAVFKRPQLHGPPDPLHRNDHRPTDRKGRDGA
jgi:type I restriction enzyme M protein